MTQIKSLGCDPGEANYGYCILSYGAELRVESCGMWNSTVTNLTDKEAKPPKSKRRKTKPIEMRKPYAYQIALFYNDWQPILHKYKPTHFTAERFQSRGLGGRSIECIGVMAGALSILALQMNMSVDLIMAATWKNRVNGVTDLEAFYKHFKLPNHIIDASFIALHGALKAAGKEWNYEDINSLFKQLKQFEL